jgi:HSP20 family protein
MRTHPYNTLLREFANFANAAERMTPAYDYARNGGSNGSTNGHSQPPSYRATLPVDVWADEQGYTLQAYVPGVNPDEVAITMEGEELTIRGQFPTAQEGAKFAKRELFHGPFERRLTINAPVDADGITAEYSNGVLILFVPKAEEIKPKQIKVVAK